MLTNDESWSGGNECRLPRPGKFHLEGEETGGSFLRPRRTLTHVSSFALSGVETAT